MANQAETDIVRADMKWNQALIGELTAKSKRANLKWIKLSRFGRDAHRQEHSWPDGPSDVSFQVRHSCLRSCNHQIFPAGITRIQMLTV
jgi:hypothetical protein